MAYYSALVAAASLGPASIELVSSSYGTNPAALLGSAHLEYARISPIIAPHYSIEDPGGFIAADFIVPPEAAATRLTQLRVDSVCWIFDGQTPIFFGKIQTQPTPDASGQILVGVSGYWVTLQTTRMREVWDDQDLSKWTPFEGNDHNPQLDLTSRNTIKISWPQGTVLANGNRAQLDHFLFNEPTGPRDTKKIQGFDIHCVDDGGNASTAIDFFVYGRPDAEVGAGVEDTLVSRGTAVGTFTDKETAVADAWPSASGYRCIRLGMQANSAQTLGQDRQFVFDRLRVGTREELFTAFGSPPDTSDIAADVFRVHTNSVNWLDTPADFWRQTSSLTAYGSDPVTRAVEASAIGADAIVFTNWVAPSEVLAALSTIDGFRCGFYFPSLAKTGWWVPSLVPWPFMMPALAYEAWSPLDTPDYRISIRRGAEPEMDDSPQPLVQSLYVSYEHSNGRPFSAYFEDSETVNYLYAQGVRRAEDYVVEAPVSDTVAQNLADQIFTLRRQPLAVGKITLFANRPGSIIDANGANVPRLSTIRPGVAQIVDLPRTQFKTGRITKVEWFGETLDHPERVELTMEHPGKVNLPRRLGAIGVLAQRTVRARGRGASGARR